VGRSDKPPAGRRNIQSLTRLLGDVPLAVVPGGGDVRPAGDAAGAPLFLDETPGDMALSPKGKRRERPALKALIAFEAAARYESFLKAADELCVTPSAVSYQVRGLEEQLGVQLFSRKNQSVCLTETGESYFRMVQSALERIDSATDHLHKLETTKSLKIRCAISFAVQWLMPNLPQFLSEHPELHVRIDTTRAFGSFFNREAGDLEICFGSSEFTDMHVEPVVFENILPMCSPKLLAGSKPIKSPADIANFPLIHSVNSFHLWDGWLSAHDVDRQPVASDLRFDRAFLAIQAAVNGLGIILEGDFLVRGELMDGRLVTVLPDLEPRVKTCRHFLIYPHSRGRSAHVQAFRQWLLRQMAACER